MDLISNDDAPPLPGAGVQGPLGAVTYDGRPESERLGRQKLRDFIIAHRSISESAYVLEDAPRAVHAKAGDPAVIAGAVFGNAHPVVKWATAPMSKATSVSTRS